jgi:hypothetical protein
MKKEKFPPEVLEFFKQQGAKGGKIGGSKAWEHLSPEERTARAKRAVAAREAKRAASKNAKVMSKRIGSKKARRQEPR